MKMGYCPECGNTKPKPMIAGFCQYHYWQSRSKSKEVFEDDQEEMKPVKISTKKQDGIPALLNLASIIFNKAIKRRDIKEGGAFCISCSEWKTEAELQAGHYMPSTYSILKFDEMNVHAECITCNCGDPDHLIGYRKNLINKIGLQAVTDLESISLAADFKWDRQFLLDIISKYKLK